MASYRCDETWHRLREWTYGQTPSERLAAQILISEGYTSVDPSHPLGGPDGGRDAVCLRNGETWIQAVYFPRGQKSFAETSKKIKADLRAARKHSPVGVAFVTNQEFTLAQRDKVHTFVESINLRLELYHLERISMILDTPKMAGIREQFLKIEIPQKHQNGTGGEGGSGTIFGNNGTIIGGKGGNGGISGIGGKGGGGIAYGDNCKIIGGDGGHSGTADGRGGRGARSPLECQNMPTDMWGYGYGGSGANHPEYQRRLVILKSIRTEYMNKFPHEVPFIDAGIDPVPINWVNKRLEELQEDWRIEMANGGYIMPALNKSTP